MLSSSAHDPLKATKPAILHFHTDTGGETHSHVHVAPDRNEADNDALQASFEVTGDDDDALILDIDDAAPLLTVLVSQGVVVPSPVPGHPGTIQVQSTNLRLTRLEARRLAAHLRWLSDVL